HPAGARRVGRDAEEVHLDLHRHGAHEVGEEEHAALEDGDEQHPGRIIGRELAAKALDGGLQVLAPDQRTERPRPDRGTARSYWTPPVCSRSAKRSTASRSALPRRLISTRASTAWRR